MKKKWNSILLKCALATVLVASGTLSSDAQTLKKISVSQATGSMAYVPFYVAQTKGYFKDEGLEVDVTLAGGGPKAMSALLSDSVDFALGGATDQINAYRAGKRNVRVIGSLMKGLSLAVVMQNDLAKKLNLTPKTPLADRIIAMKGKNVSMTTPGSITDFFMRMLMLTHGFQPDKDVNLVPTGSNEAMLASLRTGALEVCSCALPLNIISVSEGFGMPLADGGDFPQYKELLFTSVYATDRMISGDPETVDRFARALTRAINLVRTDPEAAKQATRPFFKNMKPEIYDASWNYILPYIPDRLEVPEAAVSQLFDFFSAAKVNVGADRPPFGDLVDTAFAKRAALQVK
jgi:NitT/TauT family transport system substrate-binding protein